MKHLYDRSWPRRHGVTALISKSLVGGTNAAITARYSEGPDSSPPDPRHTGVLQRSRFTLGFVWATMESSRCRDNTRGRECVSDRRVYYVRNHTRAVMAERKRKREAKCFTVTFAFSMQYGIQKKGIVDLQIRHGFVSPAFPDFCRNHRDWLFGLRNNALSDIN
jgi:hypothetical protein